MRCFLCINVFGEANNLVKHLKVIHGLCTGRTLYLQCGQVGCSRFFTSFSGLRKHLNKCHVNSACDVIVETEPPHCQSVLDSTNANPAEETYEAEVESEPADRKSVV